MKHKDSQGNKPTDSSAPTREQLVAAAAPETRQAVGALCSLRQTHLSDYDGGLPR